jgi:hypothetical protein
MKKSYEGEKSSQMLLKDIGASVLIQRRDEMDKTLEIQDDIFL